MDTQLANQIRGDFPILATEMNGKPLVYFDNGATTQKPQVVIDALVNFYQRDNANIHRGVYELSQRATDAFEAARKKVASFLNVADAAECLFVRGTTEAINLVASSWGRHNLRHGDEVIVTGLEHHSNIVPWQLVCAEVGAKLVVWNADENGRLDLAELKKLINSQTKMLSMQHVSNALGTIHDVTAAVSLVHEAGALALIDGAQWVGHQATDVVALGCDFYTFSGHKLFAPTGIGVLWGKRELLEAMPPFMGGGDMIETVTFSETTYAPLPNRFEAGTPDIAGAIGLGAAIDYVNSIGFERISKYETDLLRYANEKLRAVPGIRIVGDSDDKASVISIVIEQPSIAPIDIATHLSNDGIAIRTGHHCCMPLMGQLDVPGTSRISLAMYNTPEEVDLCVASLKRLIDNRLAKQGGTSSSDHSTAAVDSADQAGESNGGESTVLTFGEATADSPTAAADLLAEEFLMFDDRESKTELLMELGDELPREFEQLKALTTAVPGCMSEVYLVGRPNPDTPESFEFSADSNAEVVRGLIAVLLKLFSGQRADAILDFDIESFFRKIGFDQFVSTQRRSGLDGMIKRIRFLAEQIVQRQS